MRTGSRIRSAPGRRFPFELPRTDNANYLWIQLFASSLNATGRAGFIMANSASDARSSEQEIRQKLIESRIVDVMVAVGPNMFYTVTLPCTLWFFDKGKAKSPHADTVLFVDARHIYRQVEGLVILDILTRPAPELSEEERNEVKKVARELLTKLKDLLVISWRQKSGARSQVKLAIEDLLDSGLPRKYSPELYQMKCSAVFEHVFELSRSGYGSLWSGVMGAIAILR